MMAQTMRDPGVPLAVIGHRGARAVAPENTLTGFRRAEADGADGIELDVRCTRDGVAVIMHDADIAGTTTGSGLVAELDAAALRAVDPGDGLGVPTLADALDSVGLTVQVEIKDPNAVPIVVAEVARRADSERFTLSSSDREVLRRIGNESPPSLRLGLISEKLDDDVVAAALDFGAVTVYPGIRGTVPASIASAHRAGLQVHIWMINNRAELNEAIELGVDGVTTDNPGVIVTMLRQGDPARS